MFGISNVVILDKHINISMPKSPEEGSQEFPKQCLSMDKELQTDPPLTPNLDEAKSRIQSLEEENCHLGGRLNSFEQQIKHATDVSLCIPKTFV